MDWNWFHARKKTRCPGPGVLAAFVDDALTGQELEGFRQHLIQCDDCFEAVEQLSLLSKQPLPELPYELERTARSLVQSRRWFPAWPEWRVAGALAVLCLGIAVAAWVWTAEGLVPSAVESPADVRTVRGAEADSPSLVVLAPEKDATVSRRQIRLSWEPIAGALSYDVSIVDSEGTLAWVRQVNAGTRTLIPSDPELAPGTYFVLVQASLENGRLVKADFVRFTLTE